MAEHWRARRGLRTREIRTEIDASAMAKLEERMARALQDMVSSVESLSQRLAVLEQERIDLGKLGGYMMELSRDISAAKSDLDRFASGLGESLRGKDAA